MKKTTPKNVKVKVTDALNIDWDNPVYTGKPSRIRVRKIKECSLTEAIVDDVCERIASGETLTSICIGEAYPTFRTFNKWILNHKEVEEKYLLARSIQADFFADEVVDICDHPMNQLKQFITDFTKRKNLTKSYVAAFKAISTYVSQCNKQKSEARKWAASKIKPSRYGVVKENGLKEKLEDIKTIDLSQLTDEELNVIEAAHAITARIGLNKSRAST